MEARAATVRSGAPRHGGIEMKGRIAWLGALIGVGLLVGGTARMAFAQTCETGYTSCLNRDTTYYCVGPHVECGRPDSGSVEMMMLKKPIGGTLFPKPEPARTIDLSMSASEAATAGAGAYLEVLINSGSSTMMRAAIMRRLMMGHLSWVVSLTPGGALPPSRASVSVRAGSRSVGFFHPSGGTVVAELNEFPTRMRLETSSSGTMLTFGFATPLEIRVPRGTWSIGGSSTTDAVTLTTLAGSAGGITSFTLEGQGLGTLRLFDVSTLEVEPLRAPVVLMH
jgi:hypothetical protein